MNFLENVWDVKIKTFCRVLHRSATAVKLFPMPLSTLGGWYPDSHIATAYIAVNIASRTWSSLEYAGQTLFQMHAALLVANNAVYLISGCTHRVQNTLVMTSKTDFPVSTSRFETCTETC